MTSVLNLLVDKLSSSATYNPAIEVAPSAILWPDKNKQWHTIIPRLQQQLPQLYILGEYQPDINTGPAIWLRCVIAETIEGVSLNNQAPILYLPGVSRQEIRAVESCAENLRPLAELQYRGVIWSQINSKDWTVLSFLKSDQGGLGVDIAQDRKTQHALQLSLPQLLDVDIHLLKGKRLDKDYFNTLLVDGDPVRDLLQWLDQGDAFRVSRSVTEWQAFIEITKSQLDFNPETEGVLVGAEKLATHEGPWQPVWERYCEAVTRYPNIPNQIRKVSLPNDLFADFSGFPQWNDRKEKELSQLLITLEELSPSEARNKILEAEKQHAERRGLIWSELGDSPLANALLWLNELAEVSQESLSGLNLDDISERYQTYGWKADNAVIQSLKEVEGSDAFMAISTAIRAVYSDWAQAAARELQSAVLKEGYRDKQEQLSKIPDYVDSEVVFFIDGLRFDIAKYFLQRLEDKELDATLMSVWAALPSVTATGKPAVSPIHQQLSGEVGNKDFSPCLSDTGKTLSSHYFKKLLESSGWQKLEKSSLGGVSGKAWCETGDIDSEGHYRGWKLAKHIDILLDEVEDRIEQLFKAGWQHIRLVTDHGWLLLPGGLPKTQLPAALVETKWSRCALIKSGSQTQEHLYPWYWNPEQSFALADGISCYKKGEEYAHGGLSLQECLTPIIMLTSTADKKTKITCELTDYSWRGLRCNVAIAGSSSGVMVDIRKNAGDASSSVVMNTKPVKKTGIASVVVEDEDLLGNDAVIVVLDSNGELIEQRKIKIGGE